MKIIFDGENKETKANEVAPKIETKYFVEKKGVNNGKQLGTLALGLVGGLVGGVIATTLVLDAKGIDKVQTNAQVGNGTTNSVITSYNFATVENPVVAISKQVGPSVVGIRTTYQAQTFFGETEAEGEGSGIVYSNEGYIITNYHVVEEAIKSKTAKVEVLLPNGDTLEATVVGGDGVTDIAVVKVEAGKLVAAEFGDSDGVEVGELAVAIGNPLGQEFAGSVTVGYVSAVNRTMTAEGTTYNLIQTDAAINSGNSGGPLVSSAGKVIGINTAKIAAAGVEGMGFSIPINEVLPIVEELITNKKIARPYIGIGGVEIDEYDAKRYNLVPGVYVQTVDIKSAAEKAGIRQGDVIVEVDGTKVASVTEINVIKNKKKVGDKLTVKLYRNGEYKTVTVTLALAE